MAYFPFLTEIQSTDWNIAKGFLAEGLDQLVAQLNASTGNGTTIVIGNTTIDSSTLNVNSAAYIGNTHYANVAYLPANNTFTGNNTFLGRLGIGNTASANAVVEVSAPAPTGTLLAASIYGTSTSNDTALYAYVNSSSGYAARIRQDDAGVASGQYPLAVMHGLLPGSTMQANMSVGIYFFQQTNSTTAFTATGRLAFTSMDAGQGNTRFAILGKHNGSELAFLRIGPAALTTDMGAPWMRTDGQYLVINSSNGQPLYLNRDTTASVGVGPITSLNTGNKLQVEGGDIAVHATSNAANMFVGDRDSTLGKRVRLYYNFTEDLGGLNSYDDNTSAYKRLNLDGLPLVLNSGSAGNVGIGLTAPSYRLHVNGTVGVTDSVTLPTPGSIYFGTANSTTARIQGSVGSGSGLISLLSGTAAQYADLNARGGTFSNSVSVNNHIYASDNIILDGNNYIYTTANFLVVQGQTNLILRSGTNNSILIGDSTYSNVSIAAGGGQVHLAATANGRVGIGTTSPAGRLDVNGSIYLGGAEKLATDGTSTYYKSAGSHYWQYGETVKASLTNDAAFRVDGSNANAYITLYAQYSGSPSQPGIVVYRTDANVSFWHNGNGGDTWTQGNMSALSFTDRTPHYDGDALADLAPVKGTANKGGHSEIDHSTLPAFARKTLTHTHKDADGNDVEVVEEGRDLGAMISILTKAIQQLAARLDAIEQKTYLALENPKETPHE